MSWLFFDAGGTLMDEGPLPDAVRVLERLAAAGYRLGLIENVHTAQEVARLEWSGLLEHFEVSVLSRDVGLAKPDPAIFRLALSMAGCEAAQATMVGDRPDQDLTPAKGLGMRTIWLQRGENACDIPSAETEEPDLVVSSLLELSQLLGA